MVKRIPINMGQYGLSANPAFLGYIESYPNHELFFWGVGGVSSNVGLTEKFIIKFSDRLDFGSLGVSILPVVTPDLVLMFPEKNWSFDRNFGIGHFTDPRLDEEEEKKND